MSRTRILRSQQEAALGMFGELLDRALKIGTRADAYALSLRLARLAGVLRTHFALEDQLLYPQMMHSGEREAALAARLFQREMGHLAAHFERFMSRWSSSKALFLAPGQFHFEAGYLFAAITDRINREDRDLYPLADRIAQPAAIGRGWQSPAGRVQRSAGMAGRSPA